jgi:Protein of unknown function (DUF3795)
MIIIKLTVMEKLISCCGLDCATCEARIATIKNDDALRKATSEKWATMYNVPDMSPSMINCTGCREPGVKLAHASVCEIRKCADTRGFKTCGECPEMETCKLVSGIHSHVPEAKQNLMNLN